MRTIRQRRQAADRALLAELAELARSGPAIIRARAGIGAAILRWWISTGQSGSPFRGRLRLHGNWCGPGHGGGPCVDALDCACRRHDRAYLTAAAQAATVQAPDSTWARMRGRLRPWT